MSLNDAYKINLNPEIFFYVDPIIKQFSSVANLIILEGSWAWEGTSKSSDIDLEIVVDSFSDLLKIDPINKKFKDLLGRIHLLVNSLKSFPEIKLLQDKICLNGTKISIKIQKERTFRDLLFFGLTEIQSPNYIKSLRVGSGKNKNLYYFQRNFEGRKKRFLKKTIVKNDFQVTLVPVTLFDKHGKFYPGSMLDRYFSLPQNLYTKNLNDLSWNQVSVKNLIDRFIYEKKLYSLDKRAFAFNCLSRWERFPEHIKKRFRIIESLYLKKYAH